MLSRRSPGSRPRTASAAALALALAACGASGPHARSPDDAALRAPGVGAPADPTVRPATLLPEALDESDALGPAPGGGSRYVTDGLRVIASPTGGVVAASATFPRDPRIMAALPERLGGGYLFVVEGTIWRAEDWLGIAKPIASSPEPVEALISGLDRVYVRTRRMVFAIDGRSGQALDLGPWPAGPSIASYAAADGWRAAALVDLRGLITTSDAGATWQPLDLPLEPSLVDVANDRIVIGGTEVDGGSRRQSWYELRTDGSVARLSDRPEPRQANTPEPSATGAPSGVELTSKIFGKRPLAAAIEDGWPLTDGTAIVARGGALLRVRLSDGEPVDFVRDAFPMESARCHPVPLARRSAPGAFGFVCGEPRGRTVVYAYDPLRGRLVELRRFDKPRVVTSSGNGALAVRGPCAEDGDPTPTARPRVTNVSARRARASRGPSAAQGDDATGSTERDDAATSPTDLAHPYCVFGHDDHWRELHVRGSSGRDRLVVLADGRVVVLSPPEGPDEPARLTLLADGEEAQTSPVVFPSVPAEVARVLRLGVWLDGFEERRPGVVGGWLEAGGVVLGVEIGLDGKASPGQFIRDAGLPFVSGRYGLGWTPSRRGYETTDGGMTWTSVALPEPLVGMLDVDRRACGPIGCTGYGWLRVGWGERKPAEAPPSPPPPRRVASVPSPHVQLACEPLAPPAPKGDEPRASGPPPARRIGGFGVGTPPVLGAFRGATKLPAFMSHGAPVFRDPDRGLSLEVEQLLDRFPNPGLLGRVYGWGPEAGDWASLGQWQVQWLSPFGGWPDARATLPAPAPAMIVDITRSAASRPYSGYHGLTSQQQLQLVPGDDPSHALLVHRRSARAEATVYELTADRAPIEVRRGDGEGFGEIEGAVRANGRWFLTTPNAAHRATATIVWHLEGAVANELVRVPRAAPPAGQPPRARLARRSDGRAIGVVVDGGPSPERNANVRWVLPIDVETGTTGEPQPLGWIDLAGRPLGGCTDDVVGWVLDAWMPRGVRLALPRGRGVLHDAQGRLRLTGDQACIEQLAGRYDGQSAAGPAELSRPGAYGRAAPLRTGEVLVGAMSGQTRFPLRCAIEP